MNSGVEFDIHEHVAKIINETESFLGLYPEHLRLHGWRMIYYLQLKHSHAELLNIESQQPNPIYLKEFCLTNNAHYYQGVQITRRYGEPLLLTIARFLHTDVQSVMKEVRSGTNTPDEVRPSKRRKSI